MVVKDTKKVHWAHPSQVSPSTSPTHPSSSSHQQQSPTTTNPFRRQSSHQTSPPAPLVHPGFHQPYRSDSISPAQPSADQSTAFQGPPQPMTREFMDQMMNPAPPPPPPPSTGASNTKPTTKQPPSPPAASPQSAKQKTQKQAAPPTKTYRAPSVIAEQEWEVYRGPPVTWEVVTGTAFGKGLEGGGPASGCGAPLAGCNAGPAKATSSGKNFTSTQEKHAATPMQRSAGSRGQGYRAPQVFQQATAPAASLRGGQQYPRNNTTAAFHNINTFPQPPAAHRSQPSVAPQRFSTPPAQGHAASQPSQSTIRPGAKARQSHYPRQPHQPPHPPPAYHQSTPPPFMQTQPPPPPPPPQLIHSSLPGSYPPSNPPTPPPLPRHGGFTISSQPELPRHTGFTSTTAPQAVPPPRVHAGFLTTNVPVERMVRVRWDERVGAWVPEEGGGQ